MAKAKLAFGPHPTEADLQVLQVCIEGLWYNIPGSTVHSLNDKVKAEFMKVSKNLLLEKGYTLDGTN